MNSMSFALDGIPCHVHTFGSSPVSAPTSLFVMPVGGDAADMLEGQHMRLDPAVDTGTAPPFMLAVFETPDWNDALSPWPAPALKRGEAGFGGNATETLEWMLERFLPAVEERATAHGSNWGLLGYSMAGLFALWAAHQTDTFSICGSCSGSLWYEGFTDYLEQHALKAPCSVYLSLGDREEKARNPLFARVGDATRRAAALMAASPMVKETTLVWHPGGHSGFAGERLAAAQLWMARRV